MVSTAFVHYGLTLSMVWKEATCQPVSWSSSDAIIFIILVLSMCTDISISPYNIITMQDAVLSAGTNEHSRDNICPRRVYSLVD